MTKTTLKITIEHDNNTDRRMIENAIHEHGSNILDAVGGEELTTSRDYTNELVDVLEELLEAPNKNRPFRIWNRAQKLVNKAKG